MIIIIPILYYYHSSYIILLSLFLYYIHMYFIKHSSHGCFVFNSMFLHEVGMSHDKRRPWYFHCKVSDGDSDFQTLALWPFMTSPMGLGTTPYVFPRLLTESSGCISLTNTHHRTTFESGQLRWWFRSEMHKTKSHGIEPNAWKMRDFLGHITGRCVLPLEGARDINIFVLFVIICSCAKIAFMTSFNDFGSKEFMYQNSPGPVHVINHSLHEGPKGPMFSVALAGSQPALYNCFTSKLTWAEYFRLKLMHLA